MGGALLCFWVDGGRKSMVHRKPPISLQAMAALTIAFFALALALLGVYSPWGALRFPVERKFFGFQAVAAYGGTCVLPIVLGFGAAMLGGRAFKTIERSSGQLVGDGPAFFSLMISLFAAIIGLCTTFVTLIWPSL
jgi:hypothetical protein